MGQYRSYPDKTKHTIFAETPRFNYCATGMCGWRLKMQDAHIIDSNFTNKNFGLFAVFDGHGGSEVAKFAQIHLPIQLSNNKNFISGNYSAALVQTFLKIDELLLTEQGKKQLRVLKQKYDEQQLEQSYAGCTANVCLITDKQLYVANSGDSRSIVQYKGKTTGMSIDHKPDDTIELQRIKKAGGVVIQGRVNGNLNLSRALGDLEYKIDKNIKPQDQIISAKPDIKSISLNLVDFIVIGCDGIWQCRSNDDIGRYYQDGIKNKKSLKELNENLLDLLLARNSHVEVGLDNMTLVSIILKK